jgi:hypothetical protein
MDSLDVKWRELDFTSLLSSAVHFTAGSSFVPRGVANFLYNLADFFINQIFVYETRLRKTIVTLGAYFRSSSDSKSKS